MNELQAEYDRCGWGTEWGCKQEIDLGADVAIVIDACPPEDITDNGHRLFHSLCLPVSAIPMTGRRTLPTAAWRERVGATIGGRHG